MGDYYSSGYVSKHDQIKYLVNSASSIPGANSIDPATIRRFASDIVNADESNYTVRGYAMFHGSEHKKLFKLRINNYLRNKGGYVRKFVDNTSGWVGVRQAAARDFHPDVLKAAGYFDNPDSYNDFGRRGRRGRRGKVSYLQKFKFGSGERCGICQYDVQSTRRNRPLRCGHLFHKECLCTWANNVPAPTPCPMCRAPVDDIATRCDNYNPPAAPNVIPPDAVLGFSTTEIYDPNYDGIQEGYYAGYVASYNRDYDVQEGMDHYDIPGDDVCDQFDYDSPNIPSYCKGYMDGRTGAEMGDLDEHFIGNDDLRGQGGEAMDLGFGTSSIIKYLKKLIK